MAETIFFLFLLFLSIRSYYSQISTFWFSATDITANHTPIKIYSDSLIKCNYLNVYPQPITEFDTDPLKRREVVTMKTDIGWHQK